MIGVVTKFIIKQKRNQTIPRMKFLTVSDNCSLPDHVFENEKLATDIVELGFKCHIIQTQFIYTNQIHDTISQLEKEKQEMEMKLKLLEQSMDHQQYVTNQTVKFTLEKEKHDLETEVKILQQSMEHYQHVANQTAKLECESEIGRLKTHEMDYERKINHLNGEIFHLKDKLMDLKTTYQTELVTKQQQMEQLYEQKYGAILATVQQELEDYKQRENKYFDINQKLNEFISKFSTNSTKGEIGEMHIASLIQQYFANATVINTSGISHKADYHCHLENLELMVECKNVSSVDNRILEKFYNDIEVGLKEHRINCAIFVNITNAPIFPKEPPVVFKNFMGIPIAFISCLLECPEYLKFTILVLQSIIKHFPSYNNVDNKSEDWLYIIKQIQSIFNKYHEEREILQEDFELIQKLFNNYSKRQRNLDGILLEYQQIFEMYPEFETNLRITAGANGITSTADMFQTIQLWCTRNHQTAVDTNCLLQHFGLKKNDIARLGGIRNINAKLRCLQQQSQQPTLSLDNGNWSITNGSTTSNASSISSISISGSGLGAGSESGSGSGMLS